MSESFVNDLGDDDYMRTDTLEAADEIERLRSALLKIHHLLEKDFGGFYLSAPPSDALGRVRAIMMGFDPPGSD
jgi:hypothetical protein